jgi:hypothetical protein
MTSDLEDARIHHLLSELLEQYGRPNYMLFMKAIDGVDTGQQMMILKRLKDMQLVSSLAGDELYIELTTHGIDVARHPSGYLGYQRDENNRRLQEQQAQAAKDELDRAAALATVSSAESAVSAARAAWVAAIFSLASIGISIFTLAQPDKSEQLQNQVTALQQQMALLKTQVNEQPHSPEVNPTPAVLPTPKSLAKPQSHPHKR